MYIIHLVNGKENYKSEIQITSRKWRIMLQLIFVTIVSNDYLEAGCINI